MALEIERRFLVKNDEWQEFVIEQILIEQGYLSNKFDDWIIRIRFDGANYKIALKKHIENFTNFEFEYLIPNHDGEKIMSNLTNTIKKDRFFLKVEKKQWTIDSFKEKNFPLQVAEIELSKEEEAFEIPKFVSKEITGINNLSNFSLTSYPLSKWNNDDLKILEKS